MKLFEHEAKRFLEEGGIPIPRGAVADTPREAADAIEELGGTGVLKAQVLVGGRGKAGGIRLVEDSAAAEEEASAIIGMEIMGEAVDRLLVEEKLSIEQEIYLSVIFDRAVSKPRILLSSEGGVDIEETAKRSPEKIARPVVDIIAGIMPYQARRVAKSAGFRGRMILGIADMIGKLYGVFRALDAEIAEINPLVLTKEGKLVAADAKVIVNDDSLFRQPDVQAIARSRPAEMTLEARVRDAGFAYVGLEGDVGIIGNGAGLVMASLDLVNYYGGKPANFMDIGGGVRPEQMRRAIELTLENPRIKVLLINVFAGINRCDEIAKGIVSLLEEGGLRVPLVVRMIGTHEDEGRRILKEAGLETFDSMETAVERAINLAREERR
jgi:succinyl-CoA synthetase beta subunit